MRKAIYYIVIDSWTEPNKMGNMSRHYLKSFSGRKINYAGIDLRKTYNSQMWALKALAKVREELEKMPDLFSGTFEARLETI